LGACDGHRERNLKEKPGNYQGREWHVPEQKGGRPKERIKCRVGSKKTKDRITFVST